MPKNSTLFCTISCLLDEFEWMQLSLEHWERETKSDRRHWVYKEAHAEIWTASPITGGRGSREAAESSQLAWRCPQSKTEKEKSSRRGRKKVSKELLLPKALDPAGFQGVFYQSFIEWVIPKYDTHSIEKGHISSSFNEENKTLIPKSDKHCTEEKLRQSYLQVPK